MLDWLFAPEADRRLLASGRLRGPTPWVIAIMSFSMMIVAAAGLALANAAGLVAQSVESRYSVQIPAGGSDLSSALAAVRSTPGVTSAEAVPEAEMRKTLEHWLGPAGGSADLPVPALINFDAAQGSDVAAVERAVARVSPDARVAAHREALKPLLGSLQALKWLAFVLVLLLGVAAASAVVLAARGALDTHRSTIEVMHGIGATDLQVTRLFQRKIAIDALTGSVAGGAGAAVLLLLLSAGARLSSELAGRPPLGLGDLLLLVLLPIALTVLATWVARTAVLAALRRSI